MKKLLITILLILLLAAVGSADTTYYVAASAAGSEDCSSTSDPCTIATIPQSTIETDLTTQDSYVKFKRGDIFGQFSVLGWTSYTKDQECHILQDHLVATN